MPTPEFNDDDSDLGYGTVNNEPEKVLAATDGDPDPLLYTEPSTRPDVDTRFPDADCRNHFVPRQDAFKRRVP